MRANEIFVNTLGGVSVNSYSTQIHPDLDLILDDNGVCIMDGSRLIEFIPYSNIVNVVQVSLENENEFYITYKQY